MTDWSGLDYVPINEPITGQGHGKLSAAPGRPGVKSALLAAGWAESGEETIHHNKSGSIAQEGKAEAEITYVHFTVMPCCTDFDPCVSSP